MEYAFFDDIEEATYVSAATHRLFYRKFVTLFSVQLYDQHIHGPQNESDIRDFMCEYNAAGFPGCLGSVYCL